MEDYRFFYNWIPVAAAVVVLAITIFNDWRRSRKDSERKDKSGT